MTGKAIRELTLDAIDRALAKSIRQQFISMALADPTEDGGTPLALKNLNAAFHGWPIYISRRGRWSAIFQRGNAIAMSQLGDLRLQWPDQRPRSPPASRQTRII